MVLNIDGKEITREVEDSGSIDTVFSAIKLTVEDKVGVYTLNMVFNPLTNLNTRLNIRFYKND